MKTGRAVPSNIFPNAVAVNVFTHIFFSGSLSLIMKKSQCLTFNEGPKI